MRDVKWFDTDDLGPQPARKHSPDRMVIGPPRHRLPLVITAVRVGLRPDAVAPGLSHGEVADHDLGGSQSQPHQLGRVVEVEHSQIVRQPEKTKPAQKYGAAKVFADIDRLRSVRSSIMSSMSSACRLPAPLSALMNEIF
jgi:hypothetical protein